MKRNDVFQEMYFGPSAAEDLEIENALKQTSPDPAPGKPLKEVLADDRRNDGPKLQMTELLDRFGRLVMLRYEAKAKADLTGDKADQMMVRQFTSGCSENLSAMERILRGGTEYRLTDEQRELLIDYGFDRIFRANAEAEARETGKPVVPPTPQRTWPLVWLMVYPHCTSAHLYIPPMYNLISDRTPAAA